MPGTDVKPFVEIPDSVILVERARSSRHAEFRGLVRARPLARAHLHVFWPAETKDSGLQRRCGREDRLVQGTERRGGVATRRQGSGHANSRSKVRSMESQRTRRDCEGGRGQEGDCEGGRSEEEEKEGTRGRGHFIAAAVSSHRHARSGGLAFPSRLHHQPNDLLYS